MDLLVDRDDGFVSSTLGSLEVLEDLLVDRDDGFVSSTLGSLEVLEDLLVDRDDGFVSSTLASLESLLLCLVEDASSFFVLRAFDFFAPLLAARLLRPRLVIGSSRFGLALLCSSLVFTPLLRLLFFLAGVALAYGSE